MNRLPPSVRFLLQHLSGSQPDIPLTESEQREFQELADRTHCTLLFAGGKVAQAAIERNIERRQRLWQAYDEAAAVLASHGVEFVLLKGFTHEVDSGLDPVRRYQSDLDFLCLPEDVPRARAALEQAGYGEHGPAELSDNHTRPLVKPFTWRWRGDYFDPDLPISIELHHTLWSRGRDRIQVPDVCEFWNRRTSLQIEGRAVPALCAPDRIAFAALHVLRHILRNNASPSHTFELARALDRRAKDQAFWDAWAGMHDGSFRALQTIAFQFARRWFGCALPPAVERECQMLPDSVQGWFRNYAYSPLVNLVVPNKDVLWLHLALLPRRTDRLAVAFRKLVPLHVPRASGNKSRLHRVRYHAVALARALATRPFRRPIAPSSASHTSD